MCLPVEEGGQFSTFSIGLAWSGANSDGQVYINVRSLAEVEGLQDVVNDARRHFTAVGVKDRVA